MKRFTIFQIYIFSIALTCHAIHSNILDCDSAEVIEYGSDFFDCEMDSFASWRLSLQKDDIVCNSFKAYVYRTRIRNILGFGLVSTVGTGLLVALGIAMGSEGTGGEYMHISDKALIFAGVNALVWFPGYIKFAWFKSDDERLLINEYEKSLPPPPIKKPLFRFKSNLFTLKF